jgi:hypothetical protein
VRENPLVRPFWISENVHTDDEDNGDDDDVKEMEIEKEVVEELVLGDEDGEPDGVDLSHAANVQFFARGKPVIDYEVQVQTKGRVCNLVDCNVPNCRVTQFVVEVSPLQVSNFIGRRKNVHDQVRAQEYELFWALDTDIRNTELGVTMRCRAWSQGMTVVSNLNNSKLLAHPQAAELRPERRWITGAALADNPAAAAAVVNNEAATDAKSLLPLSARSPNRPSPVKRQPPSPLPLPNFLERKISVLTAVGFWCWEQRSIVKIVFNGENPRSQILPKFLCFPTFPMWCMGEEEDDIHYRWENDSVMEITLPSIWTALKNHPIFNNYPKGSVRVEMPRNAQVEMRYGWRNQTGGFSLSSHSFSLATQLKKKLSLCYQVKTGI